MKMFGKYKALTAGLLLSLSAPVLAANTDALGSAVSDTVITAKIKSGLAANNVTHAANISVQTNNGIVSLSGKAGSNTEAVTAVEIAESTNGVKDVDAFNLKVANSDQPLTDAYITAKVRGMMIKNNLTSGKKALPHESVKVETQKGVVLLSGTVKTKDQIDSLISLAKAIDGVSKVESTLTVK